MTGRTGSSEEDRDLRAKKVGVVVVGDRGMGPDMLQKLCPQAMPFAILSTQYLLYWVHPNNMVPESTDGATKDQLQRIGSVGARPTRPAHTSV